MSKYTAEQVYKAAEKIEREGYGSDMLREYAAHLAAQAEWPSEEDVKRAFNEYTRVASIGDEYGHGNGDGPVAMRAALQSVRPPVGAVSAPEGCALVELPPADCRRRLCEEGKPYPRSSCASCGKWFPKWRDCEAAILLSSHAPTKD